MDLAPESSMLRVALPQTGGGAFVADDAVSTCPLLTPSPPTNALVDPNSDSQEQSYIIQSDELVTKLKQVEDEPNAADSTSSSSSTTAEPACVQLLNHHHYHHLNKNSEDGNIQENGVKPASLQLSCAKTKDYCFVDWNWPVIRKSCMWVFLSGMCACVGLVIAMVATLPRTCNPPVQWYQGSLMYEVFTASFQDSNSDGIGDLKGLASRADYISSLGIRTVRLNSIFPAFHFPEGYANVTSLTDIEKTLGNLNDFNILINTLHSRNISLILDLPLWPYVKQLEKSRLVFQTVNKTDLNAMAEYLKNPDYLEDEPPEDLITDAIMYWLQQGVDGFYLKGLEHFVESEHFGESIKNWKKMMGTDRALIISYDVLDAAPDNLFNILMNRVDLIDVRLDLESGTAYIRHQIETIQNSTLFSKAGAPWVHWSLGDVETHRLASRLTHGNATLGATLLQLLLPGTQSLFYGDEVGLQDVSDPEHEREDVKHMHQLAAMVWDSNERPFSDRDVLPWMHGFPTYSAFAQRKLIAQMIKLRENSPAIYVNSIVKDGITKANAEIKYSAQDILVIQRWYPRRNSYVVVTNLGAEKFSADFTKMFYSGKVVVGPRVDSVCESISFKEISLWPGESVVIELY